MVAMEPEAIIALATAFNTLVVLAALLYARAQVKATREASEAQTRPYVVVDIDLADAPLIRIYLQNIGMTMARDLSISFDPPLESTLDKKEGRQLAEIGLFTRPIPTLAPGKRYDTLFDVGFERAKSELTNRYEVTVHYTGEPRGRRKRAPHYSEVQVIDLDVLWGLEYTTTKSLKDIHNVLEAIQRTIKTWPAGITKGSGLLIKTPEDLRREHDELVRAREKQRLAQQRKALEEE